MPWQNVTNLEEINRFVTFARSGRFGVSDLCEQFGISRKTGYCTVSGAYRLGSSKRV